AGPMTFGLPVIQSPSETSTNRVSLGARGLRVEATSTISPTVSYQWRFGTEEIPGATEAELVLDGVRANHAGLCCGIPLGFKKKALFQTLICALALLRQYTITAFTVQFTVHLSRLIVPSKGR